MYYSVIKHNVENTRLRLVFSTFPLCSQMPVVFYHNTQLKVVYLLSRCIVELDVYSVIKNSVVFKSNNNGNLQWHLHRVAIHTLKAGLNGIIPDRNRSGS